MKVGHLGASLGDERRLREWDWDLGKQRRVALAHNTMLRWYIYIYGLH